MRLNMALPTASEINVFDSLDERCACEHFLGKTIEQAETLFRDNAPRYQEDLMWMGPVAFRYYLAAYIRYIQSDEASGDSDAVNCFHGLIEWRVKHTRADVVPIRQALESACRYIIQNFRKFDVAPLYGNLCGAFEALLAELNAPHAR